MKSRPSAVEKGFSLVEVTITIAIVAAVLLPLIALLAGGSGAVAKSEDRFAASGIATAIVSQLQYSPEDDGFLLISSGSPGDETTTAPEESIIPVPGAGNISESFLSFNRTGILNRALTEGEFRSGTEGGDDAAFYLTKITVERIEEGHSLRQGAPPLYRVSLSVETPAFTSEENRTRQKLSTFLAGPP